MFFLNKYKYILKKLLDTLLTSFVKSGLERRPCQIRDWATLRCNQNSE